MGWSDIIQARPAIPAALGADLEPFPYLSGFGLLHRVTRLAAPLPSQVGLLGFRNRNVADVLLTTQTPSKPRDTLLSMLGLQATHMAKYWTPETWSPLQVQDLFLRQPRPLRQCPECARYGYHCTLFQLPSITHCPWHRVPLASHCLQCGQLTHARFNQKALLGMCSCGHDLFDPVEASVHMWEFPGARAEVWIENYLRWAAKRRYSRWFCAPRTCPDWDGGFAALAAPPAALQAPSKSQSWAIDIFSGPGVDPPPRQFWGWSFWGGERPLTLAPLPATMYPRLCEATRVVVDALPEGTRTPFDIADTANLHADTTLRENVLLRPDCFISPRGAGGGATWLNLSTVEAGLAAFCGQAIDQATTLLIEGRSFHDRSLQVQRSHAVDQLHGRRHLSDALESLLTRAYTQGLGATLRTKLGRSHPESKRESPSLELIGSKGKLRAIRMCWT